MKKLSKSECEVFAKQNNTNNTMETKEYNYLPHGCVYYEDPKIKKIIK